MFGKSEDNVRKQSINTNQRHSNATPSIIGAGLEVQGNITSDSEIQLDGSVTGNLHCSVLVMGEQGIITGDVTADQVTIRGEVKGNIRARTVRLEQTARITGDVYHESLTVEAGAKLHGQFTYMPASELETGEKTQLQSAAE